MPPSRDSDLTLSCLPGEDALSAFLVGVLADVVRSRDSATVAPCQETMASSGSLRGVLSIDWRRMF